jgi:hypothetical protein
MKYMTSCSTIEQMVKEQNYTVSQQNYSPYLRVLLGNIAILFQLQDKRIVKIKLAHKMGKTGLIGHCQDLSTISI